MDNGFYINIHYYSIMGAYRHGPVLLGHVAKYVTCISSSDIGG